MILGNEKSNLDKFFGRPVTHRHILGVPGEKTWLYSWGDMEIVAGEIDSKVLYLAVRKKRGPLSALTAAELAAALALNAPPSLWSIDVPPAEKKPTKPVRRTKVEIPPATYLSLVEKDPKSKDRVLLEIRGWAPANKPYVFFFLASGKSAVPLPINEWTVDQKIG